MGLLPALGKGEEHMKAVQALTSTHIDTFLNGSCDCAYDFFGAHPARREEQSGWLFRVWAPNARSVHVAGPFNGWTADNYPMHALPGGIWECFAPGLQTFDSYQYLIETQTGKRIRKSDPFAFHAETRPGVCSKLFDLSGYDWNDGPWLEFRSRRDVRRQALNIYELHLGSWRRTGDGRYLSYREIAKWLVPYVKEMGFTAVEFLPVMEHPADDSWGYRTTGYFAPTSRFGTPHDFMYLIDQLHQAGVAVLLDWVPAHFPADLHGLAQFDGTPCFESDDPKRADLPVWRTKCFDFGKGEVQSFLTSCALFWIRQYHIDGLRMDGASSVIYLGYDKGPWHPDWTDGERNLQAVVFLRHLNTAIHRQFPAVITAAEETTVWRSMTSAPESGPFALGFTFQWNMGWAHDALHYAHLDPIYRQNNHRDLIKPLEFAFDQQFILPISHDELVCRNHSLIEYTSCEDSLKFAGVRAFYLYMLTHPGKKLVMMGTEFGQFRPWDHNYSLDWHLLEYQPFRQHQAFFRSANRFYLENAPLWDIDDSRDSFQWISSDDAPRNIIAYLRRDEGGDSLLTVLNFSLTDRIGYRLGVPKPGVYQVVFHTDSTEFGGCSRVSGQQIPSAPLACHDRPDSILVDLPPLSGIVLRYAGPLEGSKRKFS